MQANVLLTIKTIGKFLLCPFVLRILYLYTYLINQLLYDMHVHFDLCIFIIVTN